MNIPSEPHEVFQDMPQRNRQNTQTLMDRNKLINTFSSQQYKQEEVRTTSDDFDVNKISQEPGNKIQI